MERPLKRQRAAEPGAAQTDVILEVPRHPYGVRPLGSRLVGSNRGNSSWDVGASLGDLKCLYDSPLLHVLKALTALEGAHGLARLAQCSKAFYILTSHSPLWRPLVLSRFGGRFQYKGDWKQTFIKTERAATAAAAAAATPSTQPAVVTSTLDATATSALSNTVDPELVLNGVVLHSDELYRAWSNSTCSIDPSWLCVENVDRVSGVELSVEDFRRCYDSDGVGGGKPVIITDVITTWTAYPQCSRDGLVAMCSSSSSSSSTADGRVTAAITPGAGIKTDEEATAKSARARPLFKVATVEMELQDYFQYSAAVQDERPLYLFDKHFAEKITQLGSSNNGGSSNGGGSSTGGGSSSGGGGGGGYSVPAYFAQDLFGLVGEAARPDYRWLIAGPARSGSSFHVDPNGTSAWNALLAGRKKWIMYPPDALPPGVSMDGAGGLTTPTSLVQWFRDYYEDTKNSAVPPLECVCNAGEIMFVPSGWWHCVFNVEETIAITHNVVTEKNLLHALTLLREPAMCSSAEACKGSDGDVPLWVAMGGVVEADVAGASADTPATAAAPEAAAAAAAGMPRSDSSSRTNSGGLCHCAKVKNILLRQFEVAVEEKYPGKIAALEAALEAARESQATLWDRLTEQRPQQVTATAATTAAGILSAAETKTDGEAGTPFSFGF